MALSAFPVTHLAGKNSPVAEFGWSIEWLLDAPSILTILESFFDQSENHWHYQPCANPVFNHQINAELVVSVDLYFYDVLQLSASFGSRHRCRDIGGTCGVAQRGQRTVAEGRRHQRNSEV